MGMDRKNDVFSILLSICIALAGFLSYSYNSIEKAALGRTLTSRQDGGNPRERKKTVQGATTLA